MITGGHVVIYSKDAEADRAFFRDVLEFPCVDAGDGWLIFALPPSEIACHPYEKNDEHQFFFTCDDVEATIQQLSKRGVECGPVADQGWGLLTSLRLPGGGKIGLYQLRHSLAHGS